MTALRPFTFALRVWNLIDEVAFGESYYTDALPVLDAMLAGATAEQRARARELCQARWRNEGDYAYSAWVLLSRV